MRLVAGVILALVATAAAAAPIPVRLKDGASWTLSVEHGRESDRAGKHEAWSATTISKLTWKAAAKGAGQITMAPISTTPGPGSPPQLAAAIAFEIPVIVEVDETLAPGRVVNMDDLRTSFVAMLKAMGAPTDAPPLANLTDASITAIATQDLGRLAQAQGSDLKVGEEFEYDTDIPNPLGGPPIRSLGMFRLESLERKAGRAVIDWRQTFDPESARQATAAMMERLLVDLPSEKVAEARVAFATMKLERSDSCRYEIDLKSGLVTRADCTAEIVSGSGSDVARRTDRWVITQSLPEPR